MNDEPKRIKQVIVMRHDLKMRRGKQMAQAAHASMSFICRRLQERGSVSLADFSEVEQAWLTGAFAKVCCRVVSEEELIVIHDKAVAAGLEVHLITDSGKTEFHGVPTRTCLAIGPDEAEKIDEITGELQLLSDDFGPWRLPRADQSSSVSLIACHVRQHSECGFFSFENKLAVVLVGEDRTHDPTGSFRELRELKQAGER